MHIAQVVAQVDAQVVAQVVAQVDAQVVARLCPHITVVSPGKAQRCTSEKGFGSNA